MRKLIACFLIILLLAFFCARIATIEKNDKGNREGENIKIIDMRSANNTSKEQSNIEVFSLEDFSNITVGESKQAVLYSIDPHCAGYQTAYGVVYEFPLDDGRYLRIICRAGIIQSSELHNAPF